MSNPDEKEEKPKKKRIRIRKSSPALMKSSVKKRKPDGSPARGRPSVFSDAVVKKMLELYEGGATEQQVADIVGVHIETIRAFKKRNKYFLWASNQAKLLADEMVEASLFKTAMGHDYYEEAVTKEGVIEVRKYKPGDTKAQIFWLKNRRPTEWRDRVEVEQENKYTVMLNNGDDGEQFGV